MRFLNFIQQPVTLGVSSGILVFGAFYIPYCWWLACIALVPLLEAIRRSKNWRQAFVAGSGAGAVIVGGTSFWLLYALPGLPGGLLPNSLGMYGSWLALIIALAPGIGAFAAATRSFLRRSGWLFITIPLLWVLFEIIRMFVYAVLTFAPGVPNPIFYSPGFIGYPLVDSPAWSQLASIGGIYLLSFAAVAVNVALWRLLSKRKAFIRLTLIIGIVSFLPIGFMREMLEAPSSDSLRIGLVSIYMPEETRIPGFKLKEEYLSEVRNAVASVGTHGPELILLPEGGGYLGRDREREELSFPIVIDLATVGTSYITRENIGFAGTLEGETVQPLRAKRILTPQGEYVASLARLVAVLSGNAELVEAYSRRINITAANWGDALQIPGKDVRVSLMFCIEALAPGFGKALVEEEGSDVLLVMNSHSRFRDSYFLEVDTLRFLRVRALEAGVPLVASADHSPAYSIGRYGSVKARVGGEGVSAHQVVEISIP